MNDLCVDVCSAVFHSLDSMACSPSGSSVYEIFQARKLERLPLLQGIFPIQGSLCAKSLQWCLTLWDPMDCSPPGSSVHGILQARILEWVTSPTSRHKTCVWPRDQTCVSCIAGGFFTTEPPGKLNYLFYMWYILSWGSSLSFIIMALLNKKKKVLYFDIYLWLCLHFPIPKL